MEKVKLNFIYLFLISLCFTFTSCEDSSSLVEEQNIEELALIDLEKQISDIKANLNNTRSTSRSEPYVAATFDIRMEGDGYVIENIEYLTEFEYGFAQGFLGDSNPLLRSKSGEDGGIKVSCDKTGEITECPGKSGFGAEMKQIKCVGNAIKACLDGGGCAEVCTMQAIITN